MMILSEQAERAIVDKVVDIVFKAVETKAESPSQRFLQSKQAAIYTDVSTQTLSRWVIDRGLPQVKVGGVILYDIKDLDEFIVKHKI